MNEVQFVKQIGQLWIYADLAALPAGWVRLVGCDWQFKHIFYTINRFIPPPSKKNKKNKKRERICWDLSGITELYGKKFKTLHL